MEEDGPRARLEALVRDGGHDFAALSRLIGRNASYIQQFVRRGSPRALAEADRRALAAFFGVDEAVLGGPRDAVQARPAEAPGAHPPGGVVLVPRLDVGAAAGAGAFAGEEQHAGRVAFAAGWVRKATRGGAQALSVIRVVGDSMLPTLADGDDILVDRGDAADDLRDGIYVLRREGTLIVKRLTGVEGGRIAIRSDNPAYPSIEAEPAAIDIVGRVLWLGRGL